MEKLLSGFEDSVGSIVLELSKREKVQDSCLQENREFIRNCANAIKHVHTGKLEDAERIFKELKKKVKYFRELHDFEGVSSSALQEFVELAVVLAALKREKLPGQKELGVETIPYLNGYADAVGELRREMQIALKNSDVENSEYFFDLMNGVYEILMSIKFSASLVGDLKRRQDVARSQVEHARSEMLRLHLK